MVGRAAELGRLRDALACADAGEPAAVLLGGEAGIGKTRLISEFLAGVPDSVRVLRGGCVPLADGLLAYAPVVELLHNLGPGLEPDRTILSGFLDDPTEAARPDSDQPLLFAAVRRLLDHLASATTVVVVLEDLHWADPSTRALLAYLLHGMRTGVSRLLLIGTYRTDELSSRHPLRALVAELDRAGTPRIELTRLGLAETAAQVEGVLSTTVDTAVVERLHTRCDGNPFLVEELLAAGPETDPLPASTRDILLRRVRRLDPADQTVLQAVALAGRAAEYELLVDVTGVDGDAIAEPLRSAVDEQILVVVGHGYAFRHSLMAEALAAEVLPNDRVRLHRAYARALEHRWSGLADGPVRAAAAAEIAHHWCQAREPERALLASIEAGLSAERVFAQAEARAHFDRAIELWPQAHAAAPLDLADLCRHGAEAAYLEGDSAHAIALVRHGLAQVNVDDEPYGAGRLYERLGRYLWANGDAEDESINAYRRAVELAPDPRSVERARALAGLASALVYADRPDPVPWCEEAIQVARAAGARGPEGQALQSLGYCRAMAGDVEGGIARCREALAIATDFGHSEDECRAYVTLVGVFRMAGRLSEGIATAMAGLAAARRRGADRTYGNLLLGDAIEAMILIGRWDEADELLPDAPDVSAHGTPTIATNLWLSAANLHTWRGRFDLAQQFLSAGMEAYADSGHGHVRSMLNANWSEWCLWQGRFAEASEWIRRELDLLGSIEFTSLLSRLVLQGLRAEAGLTRHVDLDRLTALVQDMSARPDPPPDASAIIVLCQAELARIHGESDPERWSEAADHWSKLDMPWPLAYTRWRQAETLLAGRPSPDQRRAGATALHDAYTIAQRLGAEPLSQEILALARRTRLLAVIAPAHRRTPDGRTRPDLTARELQVLELVCAGATNRRIARQLFISEKTVSIHISRVLSKLDVKNRGEAAAIAYRLGLVGLRSESG
jgi:DNA-binding CsgD family transcriptional regulator/tetratricopeptide (TPR) repeat protein